VTFRKNKMNDLTDKTYWIAISHLPKWHTERINRLVIQVLHEKEMSWADFFEMDRKDWRGIFSLNDKELADIEFVKKDLPRLAFIAEQLQNEGYHIIPLISPDYPLVLKENMKTKSSPPVLYIKGRKSMLHEDAVAIIGSRLAGKTALDFTGHVAGKCAKELKVVVSGFAKGVDKQALDSTIEAHGKSIIVLPQGILTFQSGFRKYYESIVNGDVLVLSTFFPKAGWDVGFAMARNAYIYGLAREIYVAESDFKGGTWEGAMEGLKKRRKIYVRVPEPGEKNANLKLVELGAFPVNMNGDVVVINRQSAKETSESFQENVVDDPLPFSDNLKRNFEKEILELLSKGTYSAREIGLALKLDWDSRKLTDFLKKNPNVKTIPGKPVRYSRSDYMSPSLFG
jgi:DNA processing protein